MSKMHDVFMKTAFLFAEKSKCVSHHVGAVIVKDDRIISVGYNGTPPGMKNCCEVFNPDNFDRKEHHKWSSDNEIHAEMNAIAFAAKTNIETSDADIYVTISPCNYCLKNITMTGIKNVYYLYPYDGSEVNPALLEKVNVQEVPGAPELKAWVEMNDLLYIPTQRQEKSPDKPLRLDWSSHVDDILYFYYRLGWEDEIKGRRTPFTNFDPGVDVAYQLGINHYYYGDDDTSIDSRSREEVLKEIKEIYNK
jgi:dCMP deaminase